MELQVFNKQGQSTGRVITIDENISSFNPNDHAIYLDVKRFMADLRQGTHKTKGRSEVAGSTKKLRKQKGTGAARVGDIKSPTFRGGGRVFGPKPRTYNMKVNKKVRSLARKSAFVYMLKNNAVKVVEEFDYEAPKTKEYVAFLTSLEIDGKSLHVTANDCANVYLSSKNLPKAHVLGVGTLNTYEIMNTKTLVISEKAVEELTESFKLA